MLAAGLGRAGRRAHERGVGVLRAGARGAGAAEGEDPTGMRYLGFWHLCAWADLALRAMFGRAS